MVVFTGKACRPLRQAFYFLNTSFPSRENYTNLFILAVKE
jgi:hypothetical protein